MDFSFGDKFQYGGGMKATGSETSPSHCLDAHPAMPDYAASSLNVCRASRNTLPMILPWIILPFIRHSGKLEASHP